MGGRYLRRFGTAAVRSGSGGRRWHLSPASYVASPKINQRSAIEIPYFPAFTPRSRLDPWEGDTRALLGYSHVFRSPAEDRSGEGRKSTRPVRGGCVSHWAQ